MSRYRKKLLCSTAVAAALGIGTIALMAVGERSVLLLPAFVLPAAACAPCAPRGACIPCDPCAAAPAGGTGCYVPRLQEASANPCAVENPCVPDKSCDPCAAANPCALDNPCAAAAACDPCAPDAGAPCAPCSAAASGTPCDPCAPEDPCAPCGPAEMPHVTEDELRAVYDCLIEHMRSAFGDDWRHSPGDFAGWPGLQTMRAVYSDSNLPEARDFVDWENVATAPYVSATHGDRFVSNHVNEAGTAAYKTYEEIGEMPEGGIVAKPSFTIAPDGEAELGPLFLMEKMEAGFYEPSDDWKYSMVMPDGSIGGITQGQGAENVEFCIGCHMAAPDGSDSLLFLPEQLRVR